MEGEEADKDRKIERVRRAIKNPGARPDYHSKQMLRLMTEWPALFYAVMELIDENCDGDHRLGS